MDSEGTIDWCCLPRFDSPSVFAAILDYERGGRFSICPSSKFSARQSYVLNTNVLTTKFVTRDGAALLTDYMPCEEVGGRLQIRDQIHRRVECTQGSIAFRAIFQPRPGYALGETRLTVVKNGCVASDGRDRLSLSADLGFKHEDGSAFAEFSLSRRESAWLIVSHGRRHPRPVGDYEWDRALSGTVRYWRRWARRIIYRGPWKDAVLRSALALKLMQYSSTGEMVAAVTASLPELKGGGRNWDYRYSWIRDTAYALGALVRLGPTEEARKYVSRLVSAYGGQFAGLPVVVGVDDDSDLTERKLAHLEGYEHSRPVRVGNAAEDQSQLDVYGFAMDLVYSLRQATGRLPRGTYELFARPLADYVSKAWRKPDHGTWEIRQKQRHYVTSKMLCYAALDRASRLASGSGDFRSASRWRRAMGALMAEVKRSGWSGPKSAFTMFYGARALDASFLLVPFFGSLKAADPGARSTIDGITKDLSDGVLVRRYRFRDGLAGDDNPFLPCSFWMVNCLVGLGRSREAKALFEALVSKSNHLGLYSEELDPRSGEALGNFPQGLTHAALINAALSVSLGTANPASGPRTKR